MVVVITSPRSAAPSNMRSVDEKLRKALTGAGPSTFGSRTGSRSLSDSTCCLCNSGGLRPLHELHVHCPNSVVKRSSGKVSSEYQSSTLQVPFMNKPFRCPIHLQYHILSPSDLAWSPPLQRSASRSCGFQDLPSGRCNRWPPIAPAQTSQHDTQTAL